MSLPAHGPSAGPPGPGARRPSAAWSGGEPGNKRQRLASRRAAGGAGRGGFTLIELILVMALLSIVISLAGPSLARFFRGRGLDAEARRFVALTRYGQSRAVSEGVPMVLWIDAEQGAYGLIAETGYLEEDDKARQFTVDRNLQLEVQLPLSGTRSTSWRQTAQVARNLPAIRFTPDGFISETSPQYLAIRQTREGEEEEVWIGPSRNRLNYELQTSQPPLAGR